MPETRYNNKSKGERIKPLTKVIIRRLPPTMNEVDFLKHIDPMPDHDYYYFVNADLTLGQHASARAYINFKQEEDIYIFRDKFDGYIFLDDKGLEYPACVEFAPFQDLPKVRSRGNRDNKCNTLELDQDFIDFVAKLNSNETENESKMEYSYQIKDDKKITTTPLLEYIAGKTQEQSLRRQEEREERRKRSAASVSQDDGTNKKKSTMETELQRKRNRYPKLQSAIPEEDDGIIVRTIKSRLPNIASGMDNNNNNNNRNRKDRTVDAKQKQRETIKIISTQSETSLIEATPITIKTSTNNTTTSSGSSPISTISSTSSASVKSSEAIEQPSKINTTSTTTTAVVASNQNKYNDVRDRDRERDRDRTDERNTDRKFYKDNEYRNERNRRYGGGGGGGDGGNIKDKDDRQRNRNDENDYRRNHKDTRKDTVSSSSNNRKRENDRYFSNNTKYERNKDLPSSSSTSNNNLRNGKSAMETKDGVYKKSSDNQRQRPMETTNKITILTKGSEKDNENKAIKNFVELKKNTESSEIDDVNNQTKKDTIIQDDIRKLSNDSSNDESLKPSPTKPSPPTKTTTTNREDKGRTNERNSNRRIRNKDRPSIEIYQPGRRRLGAVSSSSSSSSANGNGKSMKNDENDNDLIDNEQTNKDDSFRSQIIKTIKDCKTAQQTCNEFINRINHHDDDDDADADDDDESMNEINRKNISSPPLATSHQTTGTAAVVEKKIVRYSQLRNRAKERREITKEDFEPISEE